MGFRTGAERREAKGCVQLYILRVSRGDILSE